MGTPRHETNESAPGPSGPGAEGRVRRQISPTQRIGAYIASLWVVTTAGVAVVAGASPGLETEVWPVWFSIPALVILFGLAEVLVVHLHLRGDAHTFSMVELPLVLGLFYVDPLIVIIAHTLAGAAALRLHRKQPWLKISFNAGVFAASATVAVLVFHLLGGPGAELTTGMLLASGAALAIANLVSLTLIVVVILLSAGRQQPVEIWSGVRFGILTNLFTVSLAIIAVIVVDSHPALAWLVVVPIAGIFLANWAYTTERRRHDGLDFLYQSTRLLHQSPELDSAIIDLLRHAQATFGVKHAELLYWTEVGAEPLSLSVGEDGQQLPDPVHDTNSLIPLINDLDGARIYRVADSGPVGAFLEVNGFHDAIIVPLVDDGPSLGALIVADQVSDVRDFDGNDLRLAETLASHTTVALENGHLEQSLEQLRVLEGQLTHQATHDPLTNLANRALFRDDLCSTLADHGGQIGAVLFIDLDDFKTVNDTLGHAAGDELLLEVAERLRTSSRETDTVARLGGDEFALLLPDTADLDAAVSVAEQVLRSFRAPAEILGRPIQIKASVGIAVASQGGDAESIMRNADTAMYQAKALGKNQHVTFHPSMYESSLRRYNLQTDLLRALETEELQAFYQPILDLATNRVVAAEALVRWHHPTLGLLAPDMFLHVAAESGLLGDIDMLVLDQACACLVEADERVPGSLLAVNVNFSPQSFRGGKLTERILETCGKHGVDPARLCVEITEDLMADDIDEAMATLRRLQDHRIRVALDDFGTGYSSLSQLRMLDVDTIKIPKPFVDDLDESDPAGTQDVFAAAIVALGRALNKTIVAEGVERPQQLAMLQELGCHHGQGYLFARPLDPDAVLGFLANQASSDQTVG